MELTVHPTRLGNELKAADVAGRFLSVLGGPSHLHECGNRNRRVHCMEATANKRVCLQGARTDNTNAAIAQVVNTAIEFFWNATCRLAR